jgi:Xaa-Pro dipeptidase
VTTGVGGSDAVSELAQISDRAATAIAITAEERQARIVRARQVMAERGIDVLMLTPGSSLYYFTGLRWGSSERLTAALLHRSGEIQYVCPAFEIGSILDAAPLQGDIRGWQEHEDPYGLVAQMLPGGLAYSKRIALDESAPFFVAEGLRERLSQAQIVNAVSVTRECRMRKSAAELALLGVAKSMTLEVQERVARILRPGITATEVRTFIQDAHVRIGGGGSTFCLVYFAQATAYPHGIAGEQSLKEGDMVLIDTGCDVHGYKSDITRSYVFGTPSARQRQVWDLEKSAQAAAFAAAQPGVACEEVDRAARRVLEEAGFGPGYAVPGLPHRTGHGIGLDLHEWTYLVEGNKTPLEAGMCFSNEPMICIYGEFGVRLEDHFYMGETGPVWFTQPAFSCEAPFARA